MTPLRKDPAHPASLILQLIAVVFLLSTPGFCAQEPNPDITGIAGSIQTLPLDSTRPLFVPTHSRVSTTVRFPSQIGAPEGRGFTEDEAKQPGEYLISWTRGESHFTVVPQENAGPLNLNVPYQGFTYVFFFYPVESQFQALASLNCIVREPSTPAPPAPAVPAPSVRPPAPVFPDANQVLLSPARALGLIDRLKLVRASPDSATNERAARLGLELARAPEHEKGVLDYGLFHIWPRLAARDPRIAAWVFCIQLRNTSTRVLGFDVASFAARQGVTYLPQFSSDAGSILLPGEEKEVFFVCRSPAATLHLAGPWRFSVSLISPQLSPGSRLVHEFARRPPTAAEETK